MKVKNWSCLPTVRSFDKLTPCSVQVALLGTRLKRADLPKNKQQYAFLICESTRLSVAGLKKPERQTLMAMAQTSVRLSAVICTTTSVEYKTTSTTLTSTTTLCQVTVMRTRLVLCTCARTMTSSQRHLTWPSYVKHSNSVSSALCHKFTCLGRQYSSLSLLWSQKVLGKCDSCCLL